MPQGPVDVVLFMAGMYRRFLPFLLLALVFLALDVALGRWPRLRRLALTASAICTVMAWLSVVVFAFYYVPVCDGWFWWFTAACWDFKNWGE